MGFDLVIRGATVVTPGHSEAADIGIAGGRIAQLGGAMTGPRELAAAGLLAIPGGIDAHTHLVHQGLGDRLGFPIWVDDFWSGSRAAIATLAEGEIAALAAGGHASIKMFLSDPASRPTSPPCSRRPARRRRPAW